MDSPIKNPAASSGVLDPSFAIKKVELWRIVTYNKFKQRISCRQNVINRLNFAIAVNEWPFTLYSNNTPKKKKIMIDFEELVVRCRKKNIDRDIHNSSWDHALILFKNLFLSARNSKQPVRIVTGTLNPDFYGELVDCVEETMKKQKVELIVLERNMEGLNSNAFASAIKSNPNGRLFVKHNNDEDIQTSHFVVVGEDKYRFELNHEQTQAVANFKNKTMGEQLVKLFNILKTNLTLVKQADLSLVANGG